MKRVTVHIDRLVLRGARIDDERSFAAGLCAELRRSLSERAAVAKIHATDDRIRRPHIDARLPRGAGAERTGASVARGIVRALTK